jgi:hypothetical protein
VKAAWVEVEWFCRSMAEIAWEAICLGAMVTFMLICALLPLFLLVVAVGVLIEGVTA